MDELHPTMQCYEGFYSTKVVHDHQCADADITTDEEGCKQVCMSCLHSVTGYNWDVGAQMGVCECHSGSVSEKVETTHDQVKVCFWGKFG